MSNDPTPSATISLSEDTPELAQAYDRLSNSQFEGGKRLVERLGLESGHRVLDVGCGTGRLARWIADIVGPSGRVVGIDPLDDRVAVARARSPGLSFSVGQAEDLSAFAAESVDAVSMSAVFHWVVDRPRALSEARRVLRRGGRIGLTTPARELRAQSTVAEVCAGVLSAGPLVHRLNPGGLTALGQLGTTLSELVALVLGADLELVEMHVVRRTQFFPTGEDVVDFLQSSSFGNFLRLVLDDAQPEFRAAVAAALDARRGPQGIPFHDHGTLLIARRP